MRKSYSAMIIFRTVAMVAIADMSLAQRNEVVPPQSVAGLSVTLEQVRDALSSRAALVVDIRERDEHLRGVIPGTELAPMSQFAARVTSVSSMAADRPIYLICNTQNRSQRTVAALLRAGYANVHWVNLGTSEWMKRGWPVIPPTQSPTAQ